MAGKTKKLSEMKFDLILFSNGLKFDISQVKVEVLISELEISINDYFEKEFSKFNINDKDSQIMSNLIFINQIMSYGDVFNMNLDSTNVYDFTNIFNTSTLNGFIKFDDYKYEGEDIDKLVVDYGFEKESDKDISFNDIGFLRLMLMADYDYLLKSLNFYYENSSISNKKIKKIFYLTYELVQRYDLFKDIKD